MFPAFSARLLGNSGVSKTPPLFPNKNIFAYPGYAEGIDPWSLSATHPELRSYKYIIQNDKLVLGLMRQTHCALAGQQPVQAAGEIHYIKGNFFINTHAPDYEPKGVHLKDLVIKAVLPHVRSGNIEFYTEPDGAEVAQDRIEQSKLEQKVRDTALRLESAKESLQYAKNRNDSAQEKFVEANEDLEKARTLYCLKKASGQSTSEAIELLSNANKKVAESIANQHHTKMYLMKCANSELIETAKYDQAKKNLENFPIKIQQRKDAKLNALKTKLEDARRKETGLSKIMTEKAQTETKLTTEISKRLKERMQSPEALQRLFGLLEAHPELNSAAAWYNFAQRNCNDIPKLCDYLELTVAFDPNSYTAFALLGFLYCCGSPYTDEQRRLLLPSYQRAAHGGNSFAHKMLNRPSTTPDREGEGQYERIKQGCENKKIQKLITNGCFDLFDGNRYVGFEGNAYGDQFRLVVRPPSKDPNPNVSTRQTEDDDRQGEHYGKWGSAGSPDMWTSRGGANNANNGTGRIPCDYQSSNRSGDLYKCGHIDVRLSGASRDDTRMLTASNGNDSVRLTVSASRDDGWIFYSEGDRGDVMCVRDRSSGNGFETGNPRGDAVDRSLANR